METNSIAPLVAEFRAENNIATSIPDSVLIQYLKEGEAMLNGLVEHLEIDFSVDLTSRALLKDYMRYAHFGARAEFKSVYAGEIYATQIKYL